MQPHASRRVISDTFPISAVHGCALWGQFAMAAFGRPFLLAVRKYDRARFFRPSAGYVLVEAAHDLEVSGPVAAELNRGSEAHSFVGVIKKTAHDRHAGLLCNSIKTGFPAPCFRTRPFGGEAEVKIFIVVQHLDRLPDGRPRPLPVQRNTAESTQQQVERKPEQRLLCEKPDIELHRNFQYERPVTVPIGGVWRRDNDGLGYVWRLANHRPAAEAKQQSCDAGKNQGAPPVYLAGRPAIAARPPSVSSAMPSQTFPASVMTRVPVMTLVAAMVSQ